MIHAWHGIRLTSERQNEDCRQDTKTRRNDEGGCQSRPLPFFVSSCLRGNSVVCRLFVATVLCVAGCLAAIAGAANEGAKDGDSAKLFAEKQRAKHVQAWRRYGFVGIPLVTEAPVIDGRVDAREWTRAASLGHILHMARGMMVRDTARFFLCYTDSRLCIAFQFARPDAARAPGPSDFFELLLDVGHAHRRYHNIGLNIEKELWSGIGPDVDKKAWSPKYEYKARLTEFGWEGEMAMPFAEFNGMKSAPAPGAIWGVDLVRNERTPTDRLAHWSWRSTWHATKDLGHLMFTGAPLAVRTEHVGWMPQFKKMGVELAVSNFSDKPVKLDALLELRKASKKLTMEFMPALDSAFTEDLDAATGAQMDDEIKRALEPFAIETRSERAVTVPANTTKQVALVAPDTPGNYLVGVVLKRNGVMQTAMNVPFVVTVPLNITVKSYLYSANVLAYTADLRRVREKITEKSTLSLDARLGEKGKVVATANHKGLAGKEEVQGELKLQPTSGATYYVTAAIRDGGKEVARNSTPLILAKKPAWIGNQVGRSTFVPRPWTPLKADAKRIDTLTIRYDWRRGSIFPAVKVKGKEIFAAPMSLVFKDGEGRDTALKLTSFKLEKSGIERAEYTFTGTLGKIGTVEGQIAVEFDGFMWYDITLTPKGKADLSLCRFTATLKNEYARTYTRGRMAKGTKYPVPKGHDVAGVPETEIVYPFTFQTWIGYVEGGLQWYCENARNWHNEKPKEAMRIKRGPNATTFTVNYVDKAIPLGKPIDWHFGLMPTPARVKVGGAEDHAYYQMYGTPTTDMPDPNLEKTDAGKYRGLVARQTLLRETLAQNGVKAVILFSAYSDLMGYPGIKDPAKRERLHKFVKLMHGQGIKVLVYNGWGITTKCDEWKDFGTELVNLPLKNSGCATYWNSPASLYPDLFLWRLKEHVLEFNLDGIYMDSTTGVNYSTHPNGMRWTDEKGNVRGSYPVRAMRDFTKRIYKALNGEVVNDGIYYNHHALQANVCVENFVNVRCPSEFAQFYDDELDEAFVDCFLAKNGGIQYGFHAELTNKNWMRSIRKSVNELNAIAVPTGVSFKAISFKNWTKSDYSRMAQPMHKIWAAFTWLESGKAVHLPWWENAQYISTAPKDGILTAIWLRKGEKALVSVSNLPDEERTMTATLDLKAMGFGDVKAEDAILGGPVPIQDGTVTLTIEPRRWRLLKLERAK